MPASGGAGLELLVISRGIVAALRCWCCASASGMDPGYILLWIHHAWNCFTPYGVKCVQHVAVVSGDYQGEHVQKQEDREVLT